MYGTGTPEGHGFPLVISLTSEKHAYVHAYTRAIAQIVNEKLNEGDKLGLF